MAVDSKRLIQDATPLEKSILGDIEDKTGLTFRKLGAIDTRDKATAAAVLPVLAEWVAKLDDPPHRCAVYSRFQTPHAYAFLDRIIFWWANEQDLLASGVLTQDLALLVRCTDADRIWKLCQKFPPRPFHYMLVSKLATCATVERPAKDVLVQALKTESLRAGDLSYIAQVNDSRIREWFEGKVECQDQYIRAVAKRAVSRLKPWPAGLVYAQSKPERGNELSSTEEDLVHIKRLLRLLAKKFDLTIPAAVKAAAFLSSAEVGRWMVTNVSTTTGTLVSLWFRLEDIDTVEVVLLTEPVEVIRTLPS